MGESGEHLVDWGSGTGELTIPLSPFFDRVTAIDAHEEMVAVARERAQREGVENIEWQVGRAEDLELEPESCDLVVAGSSFHWMDRELLARRAFGGLKRGAALALVGGGGRNVWQGSAEWHVLAVECLKRYVGEERRPNGRKYDATKSHDEFLTAAGFQTERSSYPAEYSWGPDQIVGYLYSISFDLPRLLGDRRESFEHELREALARANPSGVFAERFDFNLTIARKP